MGVSCMKLDSKWISEISSLFTPQWVKGMEKNSRWGLTYYPPIFLLDQWASILTLTNKHFLVFWEQIDLVLERSLHNINLSFVHLRAASNWPLQATVGQNSSSVQMASACHVCAAFLVHVARRRRLDSDLDERSFNGLERSHTKVSK